MKISRDLIAHIPFAIIVFVALIALFPFIEAGIVSAANPETVIARQEVTAELSRTVASTTMVLLPSIPGLTGGTGNASTTVNIITNNVQGYSVTIQASTTGLDGAMKGDTAGGYFVDYGATTAETWSNTTSGQASQFGFGITNTSLSSANGASGYGTCASYEACFSKAPTTTPKTIVSVNNDTPAAGDTFQLKFRAHIPANTSPAVPEDWYTATTTLTATQL